MGPTFSPMERRLLGWLAPPYLTATQANVALNDFHTTDQAFRVQPAGDAAPALLTLSNRQESLEPGLKQSGLFAEFECEGDMDILPPDNVLETSFGSGVDVYVGDALEPGSYVQLTPWTRPNINGLGTYPTTISFCDDSPNDPA
jgi:hypothetical protein